MSDLNLSNITKETVDKLFTNIKRNYQIKNEESLRRYKNITREDRTRNRNASQETLPSNYSYNIPSRNRPAQNQPNREVFQTTNSFFGNGLDGEPQSSSVIKENNTGNQFYSIPHRVGYPEKEYLERSILEKEGFDHQLTLFRKEKEDLEIENSTLQRKLSEMRTTYEKDIELLKKELIDTKRQTNELERFKELFLYFIKKFNLNRYKDNYLNEGYSVLELKLLHLENYIQDLKTELSAVPNNLLSENNQLILQIKDLERQNAELKAFQSLKKDDSSKWLEEQRHLAEKYETIISRLNEENKHLREKLEKTVSVKAAEEKKELEQEPLPIKNIETKIVTQNKKDPVLVDVKLAKLTPYNVQRNIRKNDAPSKVVMGKEIVIENGYNLKPEESPKFYNDTNKDRTPTFNNEEEIKKQVEANHPEKKKEENYKTLEKRLEEIEKDIGYFKKNFNQEPQLKESGQSRNTSHNLSYDNSKSHKSSRNSSKSKKNQMTKTFSQTNLFPSALEKHSKPGNLLNIYNFTRDPQKAKLMDLYMKSLSHIEKEISDIKRKKY